MKSSGLNYKIHSITLLAFLLIFSQLSGQETDGFKPGGKPEARVFSSFGTTFSDGESHTKFDVTRAYLGYSYNFSKTLSGRVVYDFADPGVGKLKFTGMLKFAYLRYQTGKLTISGGMIPLPEYEFGDRRWGYRYLYKTLHDEYGFGIAADLGLSVAYNFAPWLSADLTVMNGEGFRITDADSTLKAGAGVTLTPVKNFTLRGYFDNMSKNGPDQQTIEFIAAWENKGNVLSAGYNFRRNSNLTEGRDHQGFSVNGTLSVIKNIKFFGRYDQTSSAIVGNDTEPWNVAKDGRLFLAGVEFALAQGVNLAPNFMVWRPADSDMPFISRFNISLELRL